MVIGSHQHSDAILKTVKGIDEITWRMRLKKEGKSSGAH